MIIICDECGLYFCSSQCPNFSGFVVGLGYPARSCSLCEAGIYQGEVFYSVGEGSVCKDCAERLVSPELLDLLDCPSADEFFKMLRIPRCEA